jgi:hypothetical protein
MSGNAVQKKTMGLQIVLLSARSEFSDNEISGKVARAKDEPSCVNVNAAK